MIEFIALILGLFFGTLVGFVVWIMYFINVENRLPNNYNDLASGVMINLTKDR